MRKQILMDAIAKLEADPENEPLPEQLIGRISMWRAHEDKCRLFPSFYNQKLIRDDGKYARLFDHQKLAICKAIGYMNCPDARDWNVPSPFVEDVNNSTNMDEVPTWAQTPEADRSRRPEGFRPSSQCLFLPTGSGKTAVLVHLAALASRNCLVITNSRDNAVQVVEEIYANTTLPSSFPVRLIRSNEEELCDKEYVIRKVPAAEETHILPNGGGYGIAVIDVYTFHNIVSGTSARQGLRLLIFASAWDLVIIDEADSVVTKEMRQAFLHGAVGETLSADRETTSNTKLRYKLNYSKLVVMSGTWHRSDEIGSQFLASLGPMTYAIKARELEEKGRLAKMKVVLVRCIDADKRVEDCVKRYKFSQLTPEKLRVVERLVRLHTAHGQKVMIFTCHHWHFRYLERLFPFAISTTGTMSPEEYSKRTALFKSAVSETHPLVWITTSKGEVGLDVPDCSVVINLVNNGSSPRCERQRMGRAARKLFTYGWFYDLVSDDEDTWVPRLAGENMLSSESLFMNAERYKLLYWDGYGQELVRICSNELVLRVDNHVKWMNSIPSPYPEDLGHMEFVAAAARFLNENLVYDTRLAKVDHVISCIIGSFYNTEAKKCKETLFDTQSQLAMMKSSSKSTDEKELEKQRNATRKKLSGALGEATRKKPANSGKRKVGEMQQPTNIGGEKKIPIRCLTREDYAKFPMPSKMKDPKCCKEVQRVLLAFLPYDDGSGGSGGGSSGGGGGSSSGDASTTADASPAALWSTIMDIRFKVNELQYESDERRSTSEACKSVLQFGDLTQSHCTFLHD